MAIELPAEMQSTAIQQIRNSVTVRRRRPQWAGSFVAVALMFLASAASAGQRVSLLGFEGDSATPIRWRVAQILKRAGHTVLGFAPPRDPDDAAELRRYAKRRRVDVFVSGSSVEGSGGWELTLVVRGPDGAPLGSPLEFTAGTLGELVKELKADGQQRLDEAVEGRAASPAGGVDLDGGDSARGGADEGAASETAWDVDEADAPKKKTKRKKGKKKSRRPTLERRAKDERASARRATESAKVEDPLADTSSSEPVPISLDDEEAPATAGSESEPKRKSKLSAWGRSSGEATDTAETSASSETSSEDTESSPDESSAGDSEGPLGADERPEESSRDDVHGRYATAIIGVNAGLLRRDLTYVDDIYGRLRTPRTNAWVYRIHAQLYPFARPVKDRIGLVAGYESAFSGAVRDNDAGADFAVTFSELYGGVRLRQPIGRHEVALQGTIGTLSAGLDDAEGTAGVPEFSYTLLSPSLDIGLDFGAIGVRALVGYKKTLGGFGQVSSPDWFPRMQGDGVDGKLGLEYRYSDEVAFELAGTLRRFVLSMNSVPQDALDGRAEVAGGAVDQYFGGYFGLNLTL